MKYKFYANPFLYIFLMMCINSFTLAAEPENEPDNNYRWEWFGSYSDVADILPTENGYYVAYRGGGVLYYDVDSGETSTFGIPDGLCHGYVSGLTRDDEFLYMATRNGLMKHNNKSGKAEWIIRMWGNAYNDCTGIATNDRFIYISTTEGARCFDKQFGPPVEVMKLKPGARPLSKQVDDGWEIYYNPGDIVIEDTSSVTIADDGTVYWGGYNRIIVQRRDGADSDWSVIETSSDVGNISRIYDADNQLMIFGRGGYLVNKSTGKCEPIIEELITRPLSDYLQTDEYLFYASSDGLFYKRTDGKKFKSRIGVAVESIGEKKKKKKSDLWLISDEIGRVSVNRIATFRDITILGTANGVYHFDPIEQTIARPPLPSSLSGPAVYSMIQSGDELWIASNGGVDRVKLTSGNIDNFPLTTRIKQIVPLAHNNVTEIFAFSDTEFYRVSGNNLEHIFNLEAVGIDGEFNCVAIAPDYFGDKLLIGTNAGLYKLDYESPNAEQIRLPQGNNVVAIEVMRDIVYIATRSNGLYAFQSIEGEEDLDYIGHQSQVIGETVKNSGLSGEEIISLQSNDDRLYVGLYDKGVDILESDLTFVDNVTWGDGLMHTDIWAIAVDFPYMWVSIRDSGVNAYNLETGKRDGIRKYFARFGLGDEFCREIQILPASDDYEHRIAFGTASGVSILSYNGDTPPDLSVGDIDSGYR